MNDIDLTIGIPTFNEEANITKFFETLKRQIISQHYSVEIIFVDDSADNTPNIIENLRLNNPDFQIRIIHNSSRKGASNAWNTIFKEAKGKVLVLLDADIIVGENCITILRENIINNVGLCASNALPINKSNNLYSNAASFIAFWLRSMRLHGLSQYTTMGRALALDSRSAKEIEIPNEIIAIDLYVQCMILKQNKKVVYVDAAKIYFTTPSNRKDFYSQIIRALKGYDQIREITKSFNINAPLFLTIKEFLLNAKKYPRGAFSLLVCYGIIPLIYLRQRSKISYIWDIAHSTKKYSLT